VPAQGPGQAKAAAQVRLPGMARRTCAELVRAKRRARAIDWCRCTRTIILPFIPAKNISRYFTSDRISRKTAFIWPWVFSAPDGILPKFIVYSVDQETNNLRCDDRFTALIPAEMSHSNRLGRVFQ
jgi:hypothetical protein